MVRSRDLPEAITSGQDRADAIEQAADCLQEALAGRLVRRGPIPEASKARRGSRDLPEAITSGQDRADAIEQAADCLQEALAGRLVRRGPIPEASKARRGD